MMAYGYELMTDYCKLLQIYYSELLVLVKGKTKTGNFNFNFNF